MSLPRAFLERPIAHRALHGEGAPENSVEAIERAVVAGYGIEIDLQLPRQGGAVVFHDDTLDRMTSQKGLVREYAARELRGIKPNGSAHGIPPLPEILEIIDGRVPLLIELKDQSGGQGGTDGELEASVDEALRFFRPQSRYEGPVAVMSFNPDQVARMAEIAPEVPRGLTTCGFDPAYWTAMPKELAAHLRAIPDADRVGASFISHDRRDLANPRVAELKAQGLNVLTWTIRSPEEEAAARRIAENVTFEGYLP